MNYSNSQFAKLLSCRPRSVDPQFAEIVTFEFYDGIETGVGFYASGETVRVASLADSNLGIYRAFEFAIVDGSWLEKLSRVALESHEYAMALKSEIFSITPTALFVGIGSLDLKWIKLTTISADALEALRDVNRPDPEVYLEVHRLLKFGK